MAGVSDLEPTVSDAEPAAGAPARRRIGLFAAVAIAALSADIVSKVLVVDYLSGRAPVRLLGGALYLIETRNSGAAFSLGTGLTVVLTAVAVVVVLIILRAARNLRSVGWAVGLGLVLGGALGNLIDRLFRSPGVGRGQVVDWLSLFSPDGSVWPVFNLADSSIVCGVVLIALLGVRGIGLDATGGGRPTSRPKFPAPPR